MQDKKIKRSAKSKRSFKFGIAGFIANLVLPGLGTIIIGKYDIGTIQIVLSLISVFFLANLVGVIIGIPIFIATWIWALFTGIKILKNLKK